VAIAEVLKYNVKWGAYEFESPMSSFAQRLPLPLERSLIGATDPMKFKSSFVITQFITGGSSRRV
jgi:hypothetical protein